MPAEIRFNRDVRPILAENCFACHGPDKNKREAELRLDTQEGLLGTAEGGGTVAPRELDKSELYNRVTSTDPDLVMPHPKSGKKLAPRDLAIIKTWIEQGARWEGHWSYLPPVKSAPPPAPMEADNAGNEIDRFLAPKIAAAGLSSSREADRRTLIRRLSFDLTGLPATAEEVRAFVDDRGDDAYDKLVERLLASPHYGERMAMHWLDLVRYADTTGYHNDVPRDIAPYRDYVIESFNANLPFDLFTIEQLAGDLLPEATLRQRVASGYNRLLQTTEEGGSQEKEYLAKYAADRVRNVSGVWLGATIGCAECHDHKFDPVTTRDFYSLAAFFADIREPGVGARGPGLPVPNERQAEEQKRLERLVAETKQKLVDKVPALAAAQREWEAELLQLPAIDWQPLVPGKATSARGTEFKIADNVVAAADPNPVNDVFTVEFTTKRAGVTALRLEALNDKSLPRGGPGRSASGAFVLQEVTVQIVDAAGEIKPVKIAAATATSGTKNVELLADGKPNGKKEGWQNGDSTGRDHAAILELAEAIGAEAVETKLLVTLRQNAGASQTIGRFRLLAAEAPHPVGMNAREELPRDAIEALVVPEEKRSPEQKRLLSAYFAGVSPLMKPLQAELAEREKSLQGFIASLPRSLVTVTQPPRMVRVLARGNWLDDSGEPREPAIPAFLGKLDLPENRRATRLDFARWLVSKDNPLPARVFMNRLWKQFFGQGLSRSLEDLGSQGEWPSHPELLDWLAVEFRDGGWDVKRMVRFIVHSAAYRQSSVPSPQARAVDPFNRLLSSQGRFRLDAEIVRDNALAIAGLLSPRIGGESVKPYQPDDYWEHLNFPRRTYEADKGERQYRRGLYTHWQRSFLHPSLLAFDATSREECTAERPRSNTPQQALALLNDPTFVEAARVFAAKIVAEGGDATAARLDYAYRRALGREPREEEVAVLGELVAKHQAAYAEKPSSAEQLLKTGLAQTPAELKAAELAAWTSAARAILNLHETITRP